METTTPTTEVRVAGPVLAATVATWFGMLRPKRHEPFAEWSERHARTEDGKVYRPWPIQRDLMRAFDDELPLLDRDGAEVPRRPLMIGEARQITVEKSSRVGYSQIVNNRIGYIIDQRPARVVVYQPTIDDAEDYAGNDITKLLGWSAIRKVVKYKPRDTRNKIRSKKFPGGRLLLKGANSPKEFRRITADVVILEEPDGYPKTAGLEGDQVDLAFKRCVTSDEPFKLAGSSPTTAAESKIHGLFEQGTQEHRYVPCPHCGTMQRLVFGDGTGVGLRWAPKEKPTRAWYVCVNGCEIEEKHKEAMDAAGEWRAHEPENYPHRSFHFWAAYSQFEGASWLTIARDRVAAGKSRNKLKVFINQVLGEVWVERGEAPPWRTLYDRREDWTGVPMGVLMLTFGVDVQKDRVEAYCWGWGRGHTSWMIEKRVFMGSPFDHTETGPWFGLRDFLRKSWTHASGVDVKPLKGGIDTGYATTEVAKFCKMFPKSFLLPVKGATTLAAPLVSSPQMHEVRPDGRKSKTGLRVWKIGGHVANQELYGNLSLAPPTDEERAQGIGFPPGYVHLSKNADADEEVCKQLVAEEWNADSREWRKVHQANEALDCWKYARAAASVAGLDKFGPRDWERLEALLGAEPEAQRKSVAEVAAEQVQAPAAPAKTPSKRRGGFINGGGGSGWFGR